MLSRMARVTECQTVGEVVAQIGVAGPRLDVVRVESIPSAALLTGVVVSGEHSVSEGDVEQVRVVLVPDQGAASAPVWISRSTQYGWALPGSLHCLTCLAAVILGDHAASERSRDVRLLFVRQRASCRRLPASRRRNLRSCFRSFRGVPHVLVDPLRSTRTGAKTLVVALRDRASTVFAHASHFNPNLTCC